MLLGLHQPRGERPRVRAPWRDEHAGDPAHRRQRRTPPRRAPVGSAAVRVLVAAARADRGATSEGLCSARVVRLLAERGHDVHLLVGQPGEPSPAEVAAEAEAAVGPGIEVVVVPTREGPLARVGWWAAGRTTRYRPDLPAQVVTGSGLDELAAVRAWGRALQEHEEAWAPDVTYVRGAGLDLTPVLAR
ncbi:hypothetical protein B7486_75160, partial [cyanobacterium TDX16]